MTFYINSHFTIYFFRGERTQQPWTGHEIAQVHSRSPERPRRPRDQGHHQPVNRGVTLMRAPQRIQGPAQDVGNPGGYLRNLHANESVYEDIRDARNARNRPFYVDTRERQIGQRRNPRTEGLSNPSSNELENIYSQRYFGELLQQGPPPPPPRQLARVPFNIITNHHPHFRYKQHEDLQRILATQISHRQQFLRHMPHPAIFKSTHNPSNVCYGCSTRLLIFCTSLIFAVGVAFLITSLYIAGLM